MSPLQRLLADPRRREAVTHVEHIAPRPGRVVEWPAWTHPKVRDAFMASGVLAPWEHQVQAAELARAGRDVVVSTGTASGKSLAYLLPILSGLAAHEGPRRPRALYLSPTKALAQDQLRTIGRLDLECVTAATLDGDTPMEERDWVRAHADLILTNPDLLHHSVLPSHRRWREVLSRLEWVVVDECHTYRGVFGSHVALLLRRLLRSAASYGSHPVLILASATTGEPAASASLLTGRDVTAVDVDASPRGGVEFALWEPPLTELTGEHGAPVRRSATAETASVLADLVTEGVRTLAFVRSRRGAEVVAAQAADHVEEAVPGLGGRVAAYRAGYLPEERRELERRLSDGELLGVAATNALELGIDVAGLDAVLLTGWPGTRASMWQQAGRAGRRGGDALAVLVARDDPLDTYLVHHPEALFGQPVEATVLDPTNPYVLGPHLECAAAEAPLTEEDVALFPGAGPVLDELVAEGRLRRRPAGWFWTRVSERPYVDLRGTGGGPIAIVEASTGRVLGSVDRESSHTQVHPGAVYLHAGRTWIVEGLDLADGVALVRRENPDWSTHARDVTDIVVRETLQCRDISAHLSVSFGLVQVTNQVVGFLRRRILTGEILGLESLDLPPRELVTAAVWWSVSPELVDDVGDLAGALHAAEHASIGLLPLVAACDRWDVGGVSTELHVDTGRPTVFVHDGHPGGAGFAARGHDRLETWLAATRDGVRACGCPAGCPSCVQSPKCGNGNEPLDKAGAVMVLDRVLAELG